MASPISAPKTPELEQASEKTSRAKKPRKTKQAKTDVTSKTEGAGVSSININEVVSLASIPPNEAPSFLPAVLSFSFDEAKDHLTRVDPRFEDLFGKLKCRPFQHLERVDPFR